MRDGARVVYSVHRDGGIAIREAISTAATAGARGRSDRPGLSTRKMSNIHVELREAILAYKAYLETGERCTHTTYKSNEDGSGSSPVGEAECVRIRGTNAVAKLKSLSESLRTVIDAAFGKPHLGDVLDALPDGWRFLLQPIDPTLNPAAVVTGEPRDPWDSWPSCQYVCADVLDALDRALARLRASLDDELPGGGQGVERANIFVENVIVGDQITARRSTVVKGSKIEGSFNTKVDDHSTNRVSEPPGTIVGWRDVRRQVIAGLLIILIVAVAIWKWPWIKEFLG